MGRGRRCAVCRDQGRDSRTRPGLLHLHELEAGDRFRYPGDPELWELEKKGDLDCKVRPATRRPGDPVSFTTAAGERVRFTPKRSASRRVAPGATVEPVRGLP